MGRGFVGADISQLETLAKRFDASARKLTEITAKASMMITVAEWTGADIDRLRSQWDRQTKPGLTRSSSALAGLSATIRQQAEQQRQTSAGSGGSGSVRFGNWPIGSSNGMGGVFAWTPSGAAFAGGAHGFTGVQGSSGGGVNYGPLYGKWGSSGFAGAEGSAGIGVDIGTDHFSAHENVDGRAGAGGRAEVGTGIDGFMLNGAYAEGFVGAEYHQKSSLDIDNRGNVSFDASGNAYAGATGSVGMHSTIAGITDATTIDGFAGARANANLGATVGPDGMGAHFGFDALAGAEAKASHTISGDGFSVGGSVSAYAGAGIDLGNNGYEISYDKVSVDLDLGFALGAGFGGSVNVSVSPKHYVDQIGHLFDF